MPANVDLTTGVYAVRPWFKHPNVVGKLTTVKEAMDLGKLDIDIVLEETFLKDGTQALSYATRRTDNGWVLGSVSRDYKILQNRNAFASVDQILGTGLATVKSAFQLNRGEVVCICCEIPKGDDKTDENDTLNRYLLMVNSHHGKMGASWLRTSVDTVCENTMNMALNQFKMKGKEGQNERGIKIRHTGDLQQKLKDVNVFMQEIISGFRQQEQSLNALKKSPFSDDEFKMLMLRVAPPPKEAEVLKDVSTRLQNNWTSMFAHWKRGKGMERPDRKDTAYGAIGAMVEYADYAKGTRITDKNDAFSAKAQSVLWGSGALLKQKAADSVIEILKEREVQKEGFITQIDKDNDVVTKLEGMINF